MTMPWFHILSGLSGLDSTQLLRYPQNPILKIPLSPNCFRTTCRRWGNIGCLTKAEWDCAEFKFSEVSPSQADSSQNGHLDTPGSWLFPFELHFVILLHFRKRKTHTHTQKSALSLILLCSPHQPNVDGVMEKLQKGRHGLDTQGMQRERERAHESMYSHKMGTPMGLCSPIPWIFL